MKNYSGNGHDTNLSIHKEIERGCSASFVKPEQLSLFKFSLTADDVQPFASRSSGDKGIAGHNLTLATLQCLNFDVLRPNKCSVYDLGVGIADRLVKIQVKSLSSSSEDLEFRFFRNSGRKNGRKKVPYKETDFDVSACVSLVDRQVIFQPGVHKRIPLKRQQFSRSEASLESFLYSLEKIGIQLGVLK